MKSIYGVYYYCCCRKIIVVVLLCLEHNTHTYVRLTAQSWYYYRRTPPSFIVGSRSIHPTQSMLLASFHWNVFLVYIRMMKRTSCYWLIVNRYLHVNIFSCTLHIIINNLECFCQIILQREDNDDDVACYASRLAYPYHIAQQAHSHEKYTPRNIYIYTTYPAAIKLIFFLTE